MTILDRKNSSQVNNIFTFPSLDFFTDQGKLINMKKTFDEEMNQNEKIKDAAKTIKSYVVQNQNKRLVQKSGECQVTRCNINQWKRKYLVDIFTTLVDMKWRFHVLLFGAAFLFTWVFFGVIWYLITLANSSISPCIQNVNDFQTAFLFSIETQTTIGYGYRFLTPECRGGIFILMTQCCVGLFIQSLITGIIFSKISRPKGRSQTIMFSEKAVVCKRDNQYNLLFRVGDMRKSHIINTSIKAVLVKNRLTSEGESIPLCQYPLKLETEMTDGSLFLIWPATVVHQINDQSPLWNFSLASLLKDHFEIIVLLEGTIESTGMSTQVRTSYIPLEVSWGERLVPLVTFQLENGRYEIDYTQFHQTIAMEMPECSAKEWSEKLNKETSSPKEADYLASFTTPTSRNRSNTPSKSFYNLFHRKKSLETQLSIEGSLIKSRRKFKKRQVSEADFFKYSHFNESIIRNLEEVPKSAPLNMLDNVFVEKQTSTSLF